MKNRILGRILFRILPMVIGGVLLLTAPSGLEAQSPSEDTETPADVVVQVQGLSCPFCAYGIEKKFVDRTEVDSVFVALGQNEVRLWLQPDRTLSDDAVRATVNEAGFTPGEIRRPSNGEWSRR